MKPFNLEMALLGAKVITVEGKEVTHLSYNSKLKTFKLSGLVEDEPRFRRFTWTENGEKFLSRRSCFDLFMAENSGTKVYVPVNLMYRLPNYKFKGGFIHKDGGFDTCEFHNVCDMYGIDGRHRNFEDYTHWLEEITIQL